MKRIALVVPSLAEGGGVPVVGLFLHRVIRKSGRYESDLVSLAMSSRDPASVRLLAPGSWWPGPRVVQDRWKGEPFRHVGAYVAELEFQRYRPRRILTTLLEGYDLVQLVAGAPCWALVARHVTRPVGLQVATLTAEERKEKLARARGPRSLWDRLMTQITARADMSALRHVDAAFVENPWMYERLREHIGPDRTIWAPPGVDTDVFSPRPDGAASAGHLLSVGRFSDPRKNVRLLFEAYHRLRQRLPDAPKLILAGSSGPMEEDWALAQSLGLEPHVEFLERLPEAELAELYRCASLYVLSSDEEGFGLVIVEAMASSLAVVSTDCGGPSTSVVDGETGFLVPRGDPEALAAKMHELLLDPDRRAEMGRRGRKRAVEQFSLEATGKIFLSWYDRVLKT